MTDKNVQILLPKPFDIPFEYAVPEGMMLAVGDVVKVPFGNQKSYGVVWSFQSQQLENKKIKTVLEKSDAPTLPENTLKFIHWVADYTLAPIGSVLAQVISVDAALELPAPKIGYVLGEAANTKITAKRQQVVDALEKVNKPLRVQEIALRAGVSDAVVRAMAQKELLLAKEIVEEAISDIHHETKQVDLSSEQQAAVDALRKNVQANNYSATVLDGITGSGKTEVYFHAIVKAMEMGKQALILLPEINLTSQLIQRFYEHFGFLPTSWHSGLTPAQRRDNWRDIASGKARLIIGARSALFMPFPDLGLVIVDEEHESAFKQEDGVIYQARDMAVARAFIENIPIVLVSASPSLETIHNIECGKYQAIHLHARHGTAILPEIEVVDMRKEKLPAKYFISQRLKELLSQNLAKKQQSLLYLNRRGYAPLTLCRTCGYRFQCPNCTSWLVLHHPPYKADYLQCHHCGYSQPSVENCPECKSQTLAPCGPGVERLVEEVKEFLPNARIEMMTSDNVANLQHAKEAVEKIEKGEVDIIIGTQMIAKGYHFPNLTLVGVVDADLGLEGGDMRAAERCYQLLHQVSGRAGRHELKGKAVLQTYMPENMVMQALASNDRDDFNHKELQRRQYSHIPPYTKMAAIIVSGKNEGEVSALAKQWVRNALNLSKNNNKIKILGPAPAPILLLRSNYRYRILVIADRDINLQQAIKSWLSVSKPPSSVKIKVDIDPYSFY